MINDILNEMIKRGFVDEYGDINDCNDNALLTFTRC